MPATTPGESSGGSSRRGWARLDRVFALFAVVFGTALVFVIPPFESADEPVHFLRAFQISEGTLIARQRDFRGLHGGYLPASLYDIWLPFSTIGFHVSHKASLREIWRVMKIPLQPDRRMFIMFANTAHYCPTCYVPQAIGIGIGRLLHIPPLAMLYLGREANLLVWAAFGTLSLRLAPAIARPLFLLLLMPMSLWTASTVSADTPTNALAILLTAWICAQSARPAGSMDLKSIVQLLAISIPLTLCKTAYAPLVGLILLIPKSNFVRGRKVLTVLTVVAINVAALAIWSSTSESLETRINPDTTVSPQQQANLLEQQPSRLPGLLLQTIKSWGWTCVRSFVALIGWSDMYLPTVIVVAYLLLVTIACAATDRRAQLPAPGLAAVVIPPMVFLSVGIIAIFSYIFWTPVGFPVILGISGRYFIPLAPAIIVLLSSVASYLPEPPFLTARRKHLNMITASAALFMCIYFLVVVWARYYAQFLTQGA